MIANALHLVENHPLFTLALAAAFVLAVCVAMFAVKRRPAKGAVELAVLAGVVAWWCLAYFLEITMPTAALKLLAVRLAYVSITSLPVLWLLLAAHSTDIIDLSRPWRIVLVASVPVLTLAFAFAYPHSRLLWTGVRFDTSLVHPMLAFSQGHWFWINMAWSYALLLVGIVLFLASLRGAPRYYRSRTAAMIVAITAPWILHGLFVLNILQDPAFSVTPLIVAVSGAAAAWALFKRRFLEIAPFARDAVFGTMADPVLVLDRAGRVVDTNPAAQALFGAARQLIGASVTDLIPDLQPAPGTPGRSRLGDVRLPAAPERWFELDVSDLADRRGRSAGRVVLLHETTDRRRMEQTLRASEEKFRRVVDSIDQVIFSLDREGRFTYVSPAVERLSGYRVSDIVGMPFTRFVHPDDLERVRDNIAGRYRGDREPHEFRVVTPGGSLLHVRTYSYPLSDAEGPQGLSGIMTDITGQKQLQNQLLQSQKMEAVGRLAGGIAHDFSNLLTAITGFSEMLLMNEKVDVESRGWVSEIKRSIERGSALVRQLLSFSRKQVVQPRALDLNELIRGIERMLERLIGEHLVLRTRLADGLPPLQADPGQLELAIVNLAVNARDAMPGGGTLTIETSTVPSREGLRIRLVIGDTGVGMDEHVRSHLFEPFFTTKEQGKGTGLGLPTVYGIVRQCGGTIGVESEPGRGTRFVIDLPASDAEPERDGSAAAEVAAAGGTERLLVVEDDPLVRLTIQACLAPLGYRLTVATDGTEALGVDPSSIDLLVTDVVMPGLSGRSLAGRMREACPELAVLFVSGYEAGLLFPDGLPDGRSAFLQKPFTTEALARAVRSLLD
ncbi:MAG: PAS domain S-box protein [Spirochaetes bacterium]|nr:PAS domain S-box protein [Spirochaetota bacterium]